MAATSRIPSAPASAEPHRLVDRVALRLCLPAQRARGAWLIPERATPPQPQSCIGRRNRSPAQTSHPPQAPAHAPASRSAPALRRCGPGLLSSSGVQLQPPYAPSTRQTRQIRPSKKCRPSPPAPAALPNLQSAICNRQSAIKKLRPTNSHLKPSRISSPI